MLEELREQVCRANQGLERRGLAMLTFGNVSGIDRESGHVAIKPSGVPYAELTPDRIVVLDLRGEVVEGELNPSSDAPTHLVLYRAFTQIGGIAHTHSSYATMFAQACLGIPCLGTTHADVFYGEVPVTRPLGDSEVESDYEVNTGNVIVERFAELDPAEMPAVLVAHHGPFVWGSDAAASVANSVVLEEVAKTALGTLRLNQAAPPIPQYLLDRHYGRKHGAGAYYGQDGDSADADPV